MKTYNLRHFSNPEILRKINPKLLTKFIKRFPILAIALKRDGTVNYKMFELFMANPQSTQDNDLLDALCMIDEMSDDIHFDLLLEIVQDKDYAPLLVDEISTADLALCVWLHEPWALEAAHERFNKSYPRAFIYFQSVEIPDIPIAKPPDGKLKILTKLLNNIFLRKRRGKTAKVNVFGEPGEFWFIIRKGEPLKRDGAILSSGETECIYYRPERFDQVVLYPEVAELRLAIYKKAPWVVEAYRKLFGWVFYSDREYFSNTEIFTLSPLYDNDGETLTCRDVEGIAEVTLAQCQIKTDDGNIITVHGKNALSALKKDAMPHLPRYEILSAKFKIRFLNSKKERMLAIKSKNTAEFKYDGDGRIIEKWLTARGFKIRPTKWDKK
jgi:hypothetical protein